MPTAYTMEERGTMERHHVRGRPELSGASRRPYESYDFIGTAQAASERVVARNGDGLLEDIQRHVLQHPARTLLLVAGVGYLIGRALRDD
jgi:hypothetical protein